MDNLETRPQWTQDTKGQHAQQKSEHKKLH